MRWTVKEIHQIALVTSRGWKPVNPVAGHPKDVVWRKDGEDLSSLENAYWYEMEKKDDGDTIPAPPPLEVGLMGALTELCEWYDEMGDAIHDFGIEFPHSRFKQIAKRIGYTFKD